jgi:hypothetical protein
MNTPTGLFGLSRPAREVWMRRAIISIAWSWPMTRWPSSSATFSTVSISLLDHPADRNAGPVADHRGDGLVVHGREDQRRLALHRGQFALQRLQPRQVHLAVRVCFHGPTAASCRPLRRRRLQGAGGSFDRVNAGPQACAQAQQFVDQLPLVPPALLQRRAGCARPRAPRRPAPALAGVDADRLLAADDAQLDLPATRCACGQSSTSGGVACRLTATRAHRPCRAGSPPCRATAAPECSGATASPPPRSPRRGSARWWCFSRSSATPRIIRMARSSSGSSTCTTWKRRVSAGSFSMCFLYSAQVVAPMVRKVPRASAGFQQVGGIAGAGRAARADSVCVSSMNRMTGVGWPAPPR